MFPGRSRRARCGFSLIELPIVIAIILIILAVAMPPLTRARLHAQKGNVKFTLQPSAAGYTITAAPEEI
jgi:prepilin-type N-terminal cleavage/methylation domain-containing protein